jgi:L,D-transpeptidase YbiS
LEGEAVLVIKKIVMGCVAVSVGACCSAEAAMPHKFLEAVGEYNEGAMTREMIAISIKDQTLTLFRDMEEVKKYIISSGRNGVGEKEGTYQTPTGLHRIAQKVGDAAKKYTVFVGRRHTGRRWNPKAYLDHEGDLVLSRILWLEGLEPGKNKGKDGLGKLVDSFKRYIYIHGTNHEKNIGTPASQGCIRMTSHDVIELFSQVKKDALVWIVA